MPQLQDTIVEIAQSQVGITESGGNNQGAAIRKYLNATWMDDNAKDKGFPWCAAFVTWVCIEARKQLNLTWQDVNLYIGAAAYGWEDWAIKQGWQTYPETESAAPGDLVTFDFSHIGVVVQDHGNTIDTIEGNTNQAGSRDGDGVWEKNRRRDLIKTIIRLPAFNKRG